MPTTTPTLLVLAAGMGSRYGGLKQIDPVGPCGEAILDYSIFDAIRAGFSKVVFVIRKDIEDAFKHQFGARIERNICVEYAFQELCGLPSGFQVPGGRTKPWGTTHAVLAASSLIHEPFAVINADDLYGASSYRVLAQHLQLNGMDYAMVGFTLRKTLSSFGAVSRGVCKVDDYGFVQEVIEMTKIERSGESARNTDDSGKVTELRGDEVVSMNMWGFTPRIFGKLLEYFQTFLEMYGTDLRSECYLPSAINQFLLSGQIRVKALPTQESWFGITYREDHARVVDNIRMLIGRGYYPARLWE